MILTIRNKIGPLHEILTLSCMLSKLGLTYFSFNTLICVFSDTWNQYNSWLLSDISSEPIFCVCEQDGSAPLLFPYVLILLFACHSSISYKGYLPVEFSSLIYIDLSDQYLSVVLWVLVAAVLNTKDHFLCAQANCKLP